MKTAELRKEITEANNLVGRRIYDMRYNDFYTIEKRVKMFYTVNYQKRGVMSMPVTEVFFYINAKEHIVN